MNLEVELTDFAKQQMRAMPGWEGRYYVKRCLKLWTEIYGNETTARVRAALNKKTEDLT